MKTIEIDIRFSSHDPGLLARKIWQGLFNIILERKLPLTNLDSFLCDLKLFEHYISKGVFYWDVSVHANGDLHTDCGIHPCGGDFVVQVVVDKDFIRLNV